MNTFTWSTCKEDGFSLDELVEDVKKALKAVAQKANTFIGMMWEKGSNILKKAKMFLRTKAGKAATLFFSASIGTYVGLLIYNFFMALAVQQLMLMIAIVSAVVICALLLGIIGALIGWALNIGIGIVPLGIGISGKTFGFWLFGATGLATFTSLASKFLGGATLFGCAAIAPVAAIVASLATAGLFGYGLYKWAHSDE